jgi:hypothetical protein
LIVGFFATDEPQGLPEKVTPAATIECRDYYRRS